MVYKARGRRVTKKKTGSKVLLAREKIPKGGKKKEARKSRAETTRGTAR